MFRQVNGKERGGKERAGRPRLCVDNDAVSPNRLIVLRRGVVSIG